MATETREARAHTTRDGTLNLSVNVGIPDADVSVVVHVQTLPTPRALDTNGWPVSYFERVIGSMPNLRRAPQGSFEERPSLEVEAPERRIPVTTIPSARFTAKQGQYLAFIYHFTKIHRRPPAEADLREYFKVSPPTVHGMILALARRGLINRVPGRARSVTVLVLRAELPELE
jgi:hypothetical protein